MELILKQGQKGLTQDFLIYGKEYKVSRGGKVIGVAEYTDNPILGDGFFIKHESGTLEVCVVDEWEFV
ncbi:hypothetical protein OAD61_00660 [bacterium]|nr:hypothetical protein [bacterium]